MSRTRLNPTETAQFMVALGAMAKLAFAGQEDVQEFASRQHSEIVAFLGAHDCVMPKLDIPDDRLELLAGYRNAVAELTSTGRRPIERRSVCLGRIIQIAGLPSGPDITRSAPEATAKAMKYLARHLCSADIKYDRGLIFTGLCDLTRSVFMRVDDVETRDWGPIAAAMPAALQALEEIRRGNYARELCNDAGLTAGNVMVPIRALLDILKQRSAPNSYYNGSINRPKLDIR